MAWTNPKHSATIPRNCPCLGCMRLETITNNHSKVQPVRYYCRDKQRGQFEPRRIRKCDMRLTAEDIELRKAKFNQRCKL